MDIRQALANCDECYANTDQTPPFVLCPVNFALPAGAPGCLPQHCVTFSGKLCSWFAVGFTAGGSRDAPYPWPGTFAHRRHRVDPAKGGTAGGEGRARAGRDVVAFRHSLRIADGCPHCRAGNRVSGSPADPAPDQGFAGRARSDLRRGVLPGEYASESRLAATDCLCCHRLGHRFDARSCGSSHDLAALIRMRRHHGHRASRPHRDGDAARCALAWRGGVPGVPGTSRQHYARARGGSAGTSNESPWRNFVQGSHHDKGGAAPTRCLTSHHHHVRHERDGRVSCASAQDAAARRLHITYGTRCMTDTRAYAWLASVIDTCRMRGAGILSTLAATIAAARKGMTPPPLPPIPDQLRGWGAVAAC